MQKNKLIISVLAVTLVANLVACGTILYPERKGMRAGKIDPVVAGLDAIGLLFYVIPGVIAFVVDYNNGTIYLPRGRRSSLDEKVNVVHANHVIDNAYLEQVLKDQLQVHTDLQSKKVIRQRVASVESVQGEITLY